MPTSRTPIRRHPETQITREALDTFVQLRRHNDYPSERWWFWHNRLHDALGLPPWKWPAVEHPDSRCIYPKGSAAAKEWRPNEEGRALWRRLEDALEDVE
jgi:hypothetical protein